MLHHPTLTSFRAALLIVVRTMVVSTLAAILVFKLRLRIRDADIATIIAVRSREMAPALLAAQCGLAVALTMAGTGPAA
jgi:hypothetical protein